MPVPRLIATKLHVPPVQADVVRRPALFALLERGLSVPVTLVSAPPGFGKSMLAADWLNSRPDKILTAWLSLDENDGAPDIFWRYVTAALQNAVPGLGETATAMLASPNPPDMLAILTTLVNDLSALDSGLVLVLDDYHAVPSSSIHGQVNFLLDHLPACAHLFILTREDPPLNLARRRARRQMVEIRAADLRFSHGEVAAFLWGICGMSLTDEQVDLLEQRTEGWVTGLQLAALSMQVCSPEDLFSSFSSKNRYIADYLIEEALIHQPEAVRSFLLKTSILERMCAELCSAVTGRSDSMEMLEHAERTNLFLIPLDDRRQWYRFHHFFAELLRQRLKETSSPETIASLHRSASDWHAGHGESITAVMHARRIPDDELARDLLERSAGTFFMNNNLPQFSDLAGAVPASLRADTPVLCGAAAWAALASNRFGEVEGWLQPVEDHYGMTAVAALDEDKLDPARRAALLEVLVIRLQLPGQAKTLQHLLSIQKQLDRLKPAQACLFNTAADLKPVLSFNLGLRSEAGGDTSLARESFLDSLNKARERQNWHLYHLSRGHLANLQALMGDLYQAKRSYKEGLEENTGTSASPYLSLLHAGLGSLLYEWNDLPAAGEHFTNGLALARPWNQWEALVPLAIGLARLHRRRGALQEGLKILEELSGPPLRELSLPLEACTAWLQYQCGQHGSAMAWLETTLPVLHGQVDAAAEPALLDVARLLALVQRQKEALTLLEHTGASALGGGRLRTLIGARILQAKLLSGLGRTATAMEVLLEILPEAASQNYLSSFLDEGESIRQLLLELHNHQPAGSLRTYIGRIVTAFGVPDGTRANRHASEFAGPDLSEREREILALAARGLTNQEIAAQLVISITTVKTHMGNIFNKLGAGSRSQAVDRARELGLLPPSGMPAN